jgi:Flp pilus assembly protein TadG
MDGLPMNTRQKFIASMRAFLRSERGNIAMMFGIALVPLMIGAGAGLDFARAMMVRQQMAESLDAAALAIGSTPGLDSASAQALAQKYFDANYTVDTSQYGAVTVNPPTYDAKGKVTLTATNNMPTVLMKLVNITAVPVSTSSTVVWGQTKLWVSLVLDNSGSMCEPVNSAGPCKDTTNTSTKIWQLKDATKTMITNLQAVSTTPGDVRVAIVPFAREVDVGTANVGASWIDWSFWEAAPANSGLSAATADLIGPNDACPFKNAMGYTCLSSSANNAATTGTIPADGSICPTYDSGAVNKTREDHYYNGCYDSKATGATKQVSSGSTATCTVGGTTYQNCTCSGKKAAKTCSANYYTHTWTANTHDTWGGCVTDRTQDLDIGNGSVTASFPADNVRNVFGGTTLAPVTFSPANCMAGNVQPLEYDWTDLKTKVDAMQAAGNTNQAIGVAHGWQALTTNGAYGAPAVPANTTRYIILLSDGLNTQNRWTTVPASIDTRMNLACSAAKTDGVVIYTLYVHVNGGGSSTPLQNCASDSSKFYDLTSSAQIAAAFADITKKITNVRVSM